MARLSVKLHRLALTLALVSICGCGNEEKPDGGVAVNGAAAGVGLRITLANPTIGADRKPAIEFTFTDDAGAPRDSLTGAIINWTIASVSSDPATAFTVWQAYITVAAMGALGATNQPTSDSKGTYDTLSPGRFRYTFAAALPDGYDAKATFRIATYARVPAPVGPTADVNAAAASYWVDNAAIDFVPAGGTPIAAEQTPTSACNTCHAPLQAHGGFRRDTRLCVTCHTPQLFDPNTADPSLPGTMNSLDFNVLVHRIHQGTTLATLVAAQQANLVGVEYAVGAGARASVFAATVPPLMGQKAVGVSGVVFPQDVRNCTVCHKDAPLAGDWDKRVTRHICASCHDATWFGDPAAVPALHHEHPPGPAVDDSTCTHCHVPDARDFDLSISGSHVVPLESAQLQPLTFEIVSATGDAGESPTVVFRITSAGQPVTSLSQFDVLALTTSGPTSDYLQRNMVRQDVRATAVAGADGTFSFTFANRAATDAFFPGGPVIPAGATGTWGVGLEGRRNVKLVNGPAVEQSAFNPVAYFAVDGKTVVKRRAVVGQMQCDTCHYALSAHGNLRHNVEYCALCHGPDLTDWAQRPKATGGNTDVTATVDGIEERSVHFDVLIHRIHTGENLEVTQPFVIYGFGGSPTDFGDVRFPGDLSRCATCHTDATYTVNALPPTALPTIANETATVLHKSTVAHPPGEPTTPRITSACLACHDSSADHAHADINTSGGVETCALCHAEGREAAVSAVHHTAM